MLSYIGNDKYMFYTSSGKEIEMTKDEIGELVVVSTTQEIFCPSNICDDYFTNEKLLEELGEYASSADSDANTIDNFDKSCCDEREGETLRNVFNYLDKLLKKYRQLE